MDISVLFNEFKNATENIIDAFKEEDIEKVEEFMIKREEIICKMKKCEYTKEEFKKLAKENNLNYLEKNVEKLIRENIVKVKNEIKEFKSSKTASSNYNKFAGKGPNFLNQKI